MLTMSLSAICPIRTCLGGLAFGEVCCKVVGIIILDLGISRHHDDSLGRTSLF